VTVAEDIAARGGILVAHDGSPEANRALLTAVRLAPVFGGKVEAVRAWSLTSAPTPPSSRPGYVPPLEDFEAATLADLENDVSPIRAAHPEVAIATSVVYGSAAAKLVKASEHVDLIVVGNRGHGGFVGLLLGSVSDQVVHHAQCRVLVDRGGQRGEAEADDAAKRMEDALLSELKLDGTE
jgi:nucleotide-binding universal stress UspA family protein